MGASEWGLNCNELVVSEVGWEREKEGQTFLSFSLSTCMYQRMASERK